MRNKYLTAALSALDRVLANPRIDSANRERLRKGHWELKKMRRSGKIDYGQLYRAVALVSEVLVDIVSSPQEPQEPDSERSAG